jgi:antitoxin HicB
MMAQYRIRLEPDDNGTLLVTSPDLPGMVTFGENRNDALKHAVDAIEEWIAAAISDAADVPHPRRSRHLAKDEALVSLPALTTLKIELYWALRESGITRAELARRLHWNRESVDRLFRLDHASKLSQIEEAARALKMGVDAHISEAAYCY